MVAELNEFVELVIFCGRMFYKDVAPLALRN